MGNGMNHLTHADTTSTNNFQHQIEEDWPNEPIEDIHWLTSAKHYDTALTYTAYGNEPSVGYKYSYAAILVKIPPWEKRQRQ